MQKEVRSLIPCCYKAQKKNLWQKVEIVTLPKFNQLYNVEST